MKKEKKFFIKRALIVILISILLNLLFLISLSSAIEIKLAKDKYFPGETLQAEITGVLNTISTEDIFIYHGRRQIPVIYDVAKIQDTYHIYAVLPFTEGNYTLVIKDVQYYENGYKTSDLIKNFEIKETNATKINFEPGFVIASEDFFIKFINLASNKVDVSASLLNQTKTLSINPGFSEKIYFTLASISGTKITEIKISASGLSYLIPAMLIGTDVQDNETIFLPKMRFIQSEMNKTFKKGSTSFFATLHNYGQVNITNISFVYTKKTADYLNITPEHIGILEPSESKDIEITFSSDKADNYSFSIEASSKEISTILNLNIFVPENESLVTPEPTITPKLKCFDYNGRKCESGEECNGTIKKIAGEECCIGTCEEKEEGGGGWIWAVLIIIIIVIILIFLFKKMKLKKKSSTEFLTKKSQEYEEKFKPKEVKGSLSTT